MTTPTLTADELLAQAKATFLFGNSQLRDCRLEAGRLLHQFVLAFLQQGNGLSLDRCSRKGITHRNAMAQASASLGINTRKVEEVICVSRAVDLLSDGGGVGDMDYTKLLLFCRFVRRRICQTAALRAQRIAESPASSAGEWEVKKDFDGSSQKLFRRAARETMEYPDLHRLVYALYQKQPDHRSHSPRPATAHDGKKPAPRFAPASAPDNQPLAEQLGKAVAHACPKDVAEMCLELVEKAEDPLAVAACLQPLLTELVARRKKASRAWAG